MSVAAYKLAWSIDTCPSARLVLLCLADHANDNGLCWPLLRRIQQATCLGYTTVTRYLKALEANGIIRRKRSEGGLGRSTQYQFVVVDSGKQSQNKPVKQSHSETVSQRNCSTVIGKQSHSERETVPQWDTNRKEPSVTINKHLRKDAHPLFERWYTGYPLKKDRGKAVKEFSKLDPDESPV